jgi:hypothetical protein
MYDDGALGNDMQAKDGTYSALLDLNDKNLAKLLRDQKLRTTKIRAEVNFKVTGSSRPAPFVQYEPGTTFEMIDKDYAKANKSSFKAWATGVINLNDRNRDERKKPRIILPKLKDVLRLAPGKAGEFEMQVVNIRPLIGQLRVSLGQGVDVTVEEIKEGPGGQDQETLGQSYLLHCTAGTEAQLGRRDLKVQFGRTIMAKAGVLEIGEKAAGLNLNYVWLGIIALLCLGYLSRKSKKN